jgi:disease resistance protein RPS2
MKFEAPSWIGVAGICASILVAIFNKWWDPVAAHVGYPFGVHRRVMQLGEKVDQLSAIKKDVEYSDPSPSSEECKDWLKRVSNLVQRTEVMKNSLKLSPHYLVKCKIGIEAEHELKNAEALIVRSSAIKPKVKPSTTRQGGRLMPDVTRSLSTQGHGLLPEELSVPDPLPGMERPYNKVLNFIKDNRRESAIMGVWGMGGVGKTTLINLVHDSRPLYRDYFVEVVFVQLGKGCTEVADLQKAIAITMGLDEIANEASQAGIIRKHLHDKNFLLFLDDLWKDFDLEVVGIPSLLPRGNAVQPHRRKVVLTTRSIDVCTSMECHQENTIQMKCLNKQYSWNLFAEIVGSAIFDHAEIHRLAEEVSFASIGMHV